MRRTFRNKIQIVFPPLVFLLAAFLLLMVPIRWLLAALFGSLVHELCHILMIHIFKLRIYSFHIGIDGAKIETEPMTCVQELCCALAGPLGGLCLLLFARWVPRAAICAAFQSLYNLLPIYPSDGGRILCCCAKLLLPDRFAVRLCQAVEMVFLFGVAAVGIYGTFYLRLGVIPVLCAWILISKAAKNKNTLQTGPTQGTIVVLQK